MQNVFTSDHEGGFGAHSITKKLLIPIELGPDGSPRMCCILGHVSYPVDFPTMEKSAKSSGLDSE